ncbi:UDP-3-O-(3-hydroxymyristoyl)glucosamine N-acyltransferase [Halorhodospira abdelmalekii]|uniref:UDP-3-O-(3-hydroxymyristoyl)glucosamine N-acyltransferase n=1 Tax=Halorhodospira abdelmalekii TaxID=421629 RepID=UPI001903BA09|nr:UDP-3-O-(3-hydroxymyristoyl)glucosamine N-acyltransferase [Halorhodospira abdelmalekii]MBK1734429.1 UDP-3-O-(3-hydroxymyristoyl)glucosamine N-acyltransferase [Halorhodospira abdelmalekii]
MSRSASTTPDGHPAAPPEWTLDALARQIDAELTGDGQRTVCGVASLRNARSNDITLYLGGGYRKQLQETQAAAVVLTHEHQSETTLPTLVVEQPRRAFVTLVRLLAPARPQPQPGIAASAVISPSAEVDASACIGAHTVVGANATIGHGAIIGPGCVIGERASVGAGTELIAQIHLGWGCRIGANGLIHPGVVIGADGFGFLPAEGGGWEKIPQIGGVCIGDDVEIGANATVDRGTLEETVIEDGVKLDDHVHIGHNARIGEGTIIAGAAAVAGSVTIGRHCIIAGACAITDHVTIADGVTLLGMTGVTGSIREAGSTHASTGPTQPLRQWRRNAVRITQLDELARRVQRLERHADAGNNGTDDTDR